MKRFLSLALTLLLASAISAQNKIPVEPGVSKALAEFRSSHISNLSYALHFDFTPDIVTLNSVLMTFDFKKDSEEDLQIDCCVGAMDCLWGKAHLIINGQSYTLKHIDEHIIVPARILSDGTNSIWISFRGPELNEREDYLYTLNVPANARKLFPCFDQPDLKASFELSLTIPEDWKAISAGKQVKKKWNGTTIGKIRKRKPDKNQKDVFFEKTEHIPTYLFSFVAGKFEEYIDSRDGMEIKCLYRETDSAKVAQLPQIMDQVRHSIKWMENYTGIPFPFPKLDFVILPGYQFGGMEHIGAIQFNDKRMFLEKNPTQDQLLSRAELIAHEVSHMWFGDLVTMKWFDDVWTKEVFANYMASMIVAEQFPDINHNLNFIRNYHISALEEDRTDGSHPIAQSLDNLKDAGLLYGNIIYKKAPIVMRKLHQLMGDEPFRTGLQKYLKKFSYSNATWDDLIDILSDEAPDANLKAFSQSWVKERGCPTIFSDLSNGVLTVTQKDIQGTKAYRKLLSDITGIEQTERDIVWPQTIDNHIYYNPHSLGWHILYDEKEVFVYMDKLSKTIELSSKYGPVRKYGFKNYFKKGFPNYDGTGYGRFSLSQELTNTQIPLFLYKEEPRLSQLMNIYENVLMHNISADRAANVFVDEIKNWSEPLLASSAADYLSSLMNLCENQKDIQESLLAIRNLTGYSLAKQKALRILISKATEKDIVEKLYDIWKEQSEPLLNQSDYINLSYQLAIRYPDKWREILDEQLSRLDNPDKRKEFEFVSRACNPDPKKQDELFAELLEPKNRKIEPWALSVLSLLNHPLREPESNRFIRPALDELLEVQQTGDIFFPKNWCTSLLSGHRSPEARQILLDFLKEQLILQKQAGRQNKQNNKASESGESKAPIPQPLLNKLLMASYFLLNSGE
ncbi:MAG: aminopeptidase [Bacteroidales bacterium]|nr:aminopeptidase [Bacteroidales bacterium]